jgi:glycosyltransferase involved in cell wall biosynthesis
MRQRLLESAADEFQPVRLLCFGNLPPRRKLPGVEVVTYFQNAHLLASLDNRTSYGIKDRGRYTLLRRALRRYRRNTDQWIVQTPLVKSAFAEEIDVDQDLIHVFPFFDQAGIVDELGRQTNSIREAKTFLYVSDARPHKNHRRLLEAWRAVAERDSDARLTVTIDQPTSPHAEIPNVDFIGPTPWRDTIRLARKSEFVVFPSLLETLGLGIVEGVMAGCKAIVPDDDSYRYVVRPTKTFDPLSVASIRDALLEMIDHENAPASRVVLPNRLDEFAQWLTR